MKGYFIGHLGLDVLESYRRPIREALRRSIHFSEPIYARQLEDYAEEIVSLGHQYGEGWLLAGEIIELIHQGAPNIVCIQPFGCLPNHITGKGVMKAVREKYSEANLIAIDYDPGASEVNQINRVKLMMSAAWEALGGRPQAQKVRTATIAESLDPPVQERPLPEWTEVYDAERTQR